MDAVIEEVESKNLLVESNGAKVVMMEEENMPPCILKRLMEQQYMQLVI
jgi:arginyl-tRNA synthetase